MKKENRVGYENNKENKDKNTDSNKGLSTGTILKLIFGSSLCLTTIDTIIETKTLQVAGNGTASSADGAAYLGNGSSLWGTTLVGTIGGSLTGISAASDSSVEPDFIVETHDNNNYARTEKRAQEIYDKFHKGHDTSYKPPVLIAETPEAAEKLLEFMSQFKSKREIYIYLTALQRVIEEIRDEELEEKNKIEKNKTKTLEK